VSADVLALAVRAADAYARVRGRWSPLCRTLVIEPDAIQPWRCSVRESPRGAGTLLFDPLPRKEKTPMAAIPKEPAAHSPVYLSNVAFFPKGGSIELRCARYENGPSAHVVFGDNQVTMTLQDVGSVARLRDLLDKAEAFLGEAS